MGKLWVVADSFGQFRAICCFINYVIFVPNISQVFEGMIYIYSNLFLNLCKTNSENILRVLGNEVLDNILQ